MGGLQSYSMITCLHICGGAIRLFVTLDTEDAWYVPWIHGGWLVLTMEDAHHPTRVTTVRRLHMEPVICTLGLGSGGSPGCTPRF